MNDSDETKIRKRISFNEKLALQVMLQKIWSAWSAFLVIFDMAMVKMVLECTNVFAQTIDHSLSFSKEDILCFIGVLL